MPFYDLVNGSIPDGIEGKTAPQCRRAGRRVRSGDGDLRGVAVGVDHEFLLQRGMTGFSTGIAVQIVAGALAEVTARRQTLRMTVTTLPSTVASLPGMGSNAGLCGISHT